MLIKKVVNQKSQKTLISIWKTSMKIAFFDVQQWEESYIKTHCSDLDYTLYRQPLTLDTACLAREAEVICIFIPSKITQALLDALPKVRLLITRSAGYDHIDLAQAHSRTIVVCNIPTYGEHTVAEYTFGLLLALSRKIVQAAEQIKKLDFSVSALTGFDLKDKTLGIVGVGRIGQHLIPMARGFGMRVLAFDPKPVLGLAQSLEFTYVSTLEELLAQADILSLHAPLNAHTYHMINKDTVQAIKPGAYLINTARGGLIDTQALVAALDNGILAGAALDVLEDEQQLHQECPIAQQKQSYEQLKTLAFNHVLFSRPNVIISPHNAFNTHEALLRVLKTTQTIVRDFIAH
ncbi:hydroxyacid dehydrogenase, partial [Candidatus Dependentiae bacterium]|nr:hydroxyacid dehydrogenase [Candidatus Dependentiae bacterium]